MSKNKVIKSVSFNPVVNAEDAAILKAISRRNFSGYVKKLIMEDIKHKEQQKAQNDAIEDVRKDILVEEQMPATKELSAAERLAQLKQKSGQQTRSNN